MNNFWQSGRVRLRAVEPGDAETFYRWNLDSERASNLDFVWPPTSMASQQIWAEEQSRRKLEDDCYHWVIELLDGSPVGTIATHDCSPRNGTFSYGIDIAADQRGKGYAAEAAWLVLRYYFDELRYQKATIQVFSSNSASIRLHEKMGFQREGVLRKMHYHQGAYCDLICFGITIEEFHAIDRLKKSEASDDSIT